MVASSWLLPGYILVVKHRRASSEKHLENHDERCGFATSDRISSSPSRLSLHELGRTHASTERCASLKKTPRMCVDRGQ